MTAASSKRGPRTRIRGLEGVPYFSAKNSLQDRHAKVQRLELPERTKQQPPRPFEDREIRNQIFEHVCFNLHLRFCFCWSFEFIMCSGVLRSFADQRREIEIEFRSTDGGCLVRASGSLGSSGGVQYWLLQSCMLWRSNDPQVYYSVSLSRAVVCIQFARFW